MAKEKKNRINTQQERLGHSLACHTPHSPPSPHLTVTHNRVASQTRNFSLREGFEPPGCTLIFKTCKRDELPKYPTLKTAATRTQETQEAAAKTVGGKNCWRADVRGLTCPRAQHRGSGSPPEFK